MIEDADSQLSSVWRRDGRADVALGDREDDSAECRTIACPDSGSSSEGGESDGEPATPELLECHALPEPSREFLALVPQEYARRHLILSMGVCDGVEHLLVSERTRASAIVNTSVRLGRAVVTQLAPAESIATHIDAAFAAIARSQRGPDRAPPVVISQSENIEQELDSAIRDSERDLLNLDGKAPSVRLVDLILFEALQRDASDVHVQPVRDRTLVRYRLDGSLHTVRELPSSVAATVVSRMKVMANLDIAERRTPQDGRATVTIGGSGGSSSGQMQGRQIDLRVSTLPSTYGERVVFRLLDPARAAHLLNFSTLGMPAELEGRFLSQVRRTTGIVLSTGPTGSGKTTTLYTTLSWINAMNRDAAAASRGCELNMMTIEDPVEYDLSSSGLSISQTQVDQKKNLTFATGLRHILRQDPDVIMVGEIRDEETARIAVQASLTGHLVLSTLHTNDASAAVIRLIDLGVEPFLVSSSLAAVLAQRLVRKLHHECRDANGAGCPACNFTGFKGRTGVFELLIIDAGLRDLIIRRSSAMDLKAAAERCGMRSLRDAGADLVRAGLTTAEEVGRVVETLEECDS